ncbi:M20/M25/M40 family metallo-hydrolase [Algoriphagus namhaensis]
MPRLAAFFALLLLSLPGYAQWDRERIEQLAKKQMPGSIMEFREFLSIPNNGKIPADIDANVAWVQDALAKRGFPSQVLIEDGVKHVFAQSQIDPKKKTILVYFQVDGQPVDSSAWFQESPFIPVLKEKNGDQWEELNWNFLEGPINSDWKIFARSASDSKGPGMTFFSALDILDDQGTLPAVNLKMIFDFQEEISSPTLAKLVERNQDLFQADGILIMDGTRHVSNLPTLAFGARGIATITLKIHGAKADLHSGQYGNFAPNPVFKAAHLLSKMKDEDGRVLIPGFYDGVTLSETELKILQAVPESTAEIEDELGFLGMEKVGESYQESLQYPSLNVRGIKAAWVEKEVRTIIPSDVIIEFDLRTVKETPAERQVELVKKFIQDEGFHLLSGEPDDLERKTYSNLATFNYRIGSQPFRADLDSDFAVWLGEGMNRAFGESYVRMRQTGGSQPMAPFINVLGIPAVSVRIPNPDNSIHAPNENIRLGNYLEGIITCTAILTQPFR